MIAGRASVLRAYNAEADSCVARVRPYRLHTTIERLDKVAHTITRLGKTMGIRVAPDYHRLRVQEITLTADYRAKQDEEKERIREERERQRDERAALAEFEREKARLAKEQSHYQAALAKLHAKGDTAAAAELQTRLAEIGEAIAGVEAREANTRALIFSDDAVSLETRLHAALADHRVNKVNARREFFYPSPAQVRDLLQQIAGQHLLAYHDTAEALEWRASGTHARPTQQPSTASA